MAHDGPTTMEFARAERADLARFLATLTPEQWQSPSLCADWSVKDVVAHIYSYEGLGKLALFRRFAKGMIVRTNQVGVDELAPLSTRQLIELADNNIQPRGLTTGFGGMIALVDGTVHHQDIRRALGLLRVIPRERLRRVVESIPGNPRLGAGRRIRGLRLRAADIDWTHGDGPEVSGPGEALMMAMTGRRDALPELGGPGHATLAARL